MWKCQPNKRFSPSLLYGHGVSSQDQTPVSSESPHTGAEPVDAPVPSLLTKCLLSPALPVHQGHTEESCPWDCLLSLSPGLAGPTVSQPPTVIQRDTK